MTIDASNPTQQDNPADTPNTSSEANEGAPDGQSSSNPGPKYNARGQDTRYLPPHEAYESVGDIEADVKGEYKFHRDLPLNELLSPAMSQYVERVHYEPLAVTMRGSKFALGLAEIRYANMRAKYGAPPASHLDRIGTVVLSKFLILTQHHETLDAMRAAVEQGMKADAMANNPFNCSIYSKTDDKPGIFRQDTVGEHGADIAAKDAAEAINKVINAVCPMTFEGNAFDRLKKSSMTPLELTEYLAAVCRLASRLWMHPLGDNCESDFRYSRNLALIAGLGIAAARQILNAVAEHANDQQAAHLASLSDDELFDEIIAARVLSGYGVGLLYVDGAELLHAMERKGLNDLNPKWIEAVVVNHVLRYVRIDTRNPGKPVVIAQRHGRRMRRTIYPSELYAAVLVAGKIPPLFNELFSVLGLPGGGTTAFQTAIRNPFYTLMLSDLAQQVGWDDLYEVVPGPEAEVIAVPAEQGSNEQVRTDCVIKGSAHLDLKTGKVEARAVSGLAPLTRYVSIVKSLTPTGELWLASLPAFVPAGNPAWLFVGAFKQLKDLGHQGGLLCVLLGVLVVDLLRRDPRLLGSSFAASAREEFPFIYVLPESPEIKETTNSGKTTLAVAFLRIMEPAITAARIMTRNTSAPALRSAFVDLLMYGTSALDEFLMPMNPEHPLCKEAMQSLSTGGITSVGKVGETHPGVRLRRPLVISSKVYWDRMFPDMRNRSYVVIVGEINEQTTAPDYILRAITTGALSQAIAIGVRRFVHDHNLVELLKTHEFPRVAGIRPTTKPLWKSA